MAGGGGGRPTLPPGAALELWLREWLRGLLPKMDNLEEMDNFLEKVDLSRLNQEEMEIMNNPNTSTDIETVIKTLPKT